MKIAFCLSGQPRTSKEIFQNHNQFLTHGIDTFMHLWWHNSHMNKVFRYHASERFPSYDLSAEMIDLYKPLKYLIEDYISFDQDFCISHNYETWGKDLPQKFYDIFTPLMVYAFLSQTYSVMKSTRLCYDYGKHDISVRMRSDIYFIEDVFKILTKLDPKDNEIYFQSSMGGGHIYSGEHPLNPCDWFFCGTPKAVSHMTDVWHKSISSIFRNGLLHNREIIPIIAQKACLDLKLMNFGAVVNRQLHKSETTGNGDPYFVPYQKYLEDFDSDTHSIVKNIEDWPCFVKHVNFRKIG